MTFESLNWVRPWLRPLKKITQLNSFYQVTFWKMFLPRFSKINAANLPSAAAAQIAYIHESAILTSSPQILVC